MTTWSQRMAEVQRHSQPHANSADSANSPATRPIGTIGAIGTASSEPNAASQSCLTSPSVPWPRTRAALQSNLAVASALDRPVGEPNHASTVMEPDPVARHEDADSLRQHILQRLERLPPPSHDNGRRLLRCTRAFLDADHWRTAFARDWSPLELFGIEAGAPLDRFEAQGLIVRLALSDLGGGCIEAIGETRATIRYRSGAVLTWCRGSSRLATADLWWECRTIIGSDDLDGDGGFT